MPAASSYAQPGLAAPSHKVRVSYGALPLHAAALAGATMGTTWSARMALRPGQEAQARAAIEVALADVVAQMSTWEPDSNITQFNQAGPGWQELPDAFFHVLQHGVALAHDTDGAYDPTIGPLVNAWGFGPRQSGFEPPSPAAIDAARKRCGWQSLQLNNAARQAWQAGGTYLDLSSIAKGYGVDRAAMALDALGITNYLVEVGGELRSRGARPDGLPWRVAVELPDASGDHALALPLHDLSIATSGDYRRFSLDAHDRYAHTIDPRTGYPVKNNVASVTVLHAGCMQADALATALTVLGESSGLTYARKLNLAALFIMRDADIYRVSASPAFVALANAS